MTEPSFQRAGTALAWKAIQLGGVKGIFMLRLLILAWLLVPEDFGLLAIATTSIGFLLSVTDFGMVPALVQKPEVSEKQYNVAWTVAITRALLISAITIATAPFIAQIFAEPRAIPIIQVLALRPLLEAAASIKVAHLTRNLQFRPLAVLKLVEALSAAIVSIALARAFGVWALVAGVLAGALFYLLTSYLLAPHRPRFIFDPITAHSLIRFGRWIFLTSLIAMIGGYALRVVISRQLGTAELGLYYLGAQLAFFPAEIASEVIGGVAFPLVSRLQSDIQRATQAFRIMVVGTSALLFPVCALIIALAPVLVQEILGERWEGTATVIRILSLVTMIGVFGEATGPIFKGLGQPYKVTLIETVQSGLIVTSVWSLTSHYGLAGAALAWLPTIIVSQVVSAIFVQQVLPKPLAGLGVSFILITVISAIGAIIAAIIVTLIPGLTGLVVAGSLALAFIGILLWEADRQLALGLRKYLGQVFPQVAMLIGYSPADS